MHHDAAALAKRDHIGLFALASGCCLGSRPIVLPVIGRKTPASDDVLWRGRGRAGLDPSRWRPLGEVGALRANPISEGGQDQNAGRPQSRAIWAVHAGSVESRSTTLNGNGAERKHALVAWMAEFSSRSP